MRALCLALRDEYNIAAVTNDIFTRCVQSNKHSPPKQPNIQVIIPAVITNNVNFHKRTEKTPNS